jgi:integrative and conjugative element protein (TIGR02256 family)
MPPRLWLSNEVSSALKLEAARRAPWETGGVLLGYWSPVGDEPVVTSYIGPGPNAVHQRYRFLPDHCFHLTEIARQYEASGRRLTYLGDWHTHPGGGGGLSELDSKTLLQIARKPAARAPRPLMVVLAPGPCWSIHAWRGELLKTWRLKTMLNIHRLTVGPFDETI